MATRDSILARYGMKFEESPIADVSPEKEALVLSSSEEAETNASGSGRSKVVFFDQAAFVHETRFCLVAQWSWQA